MPTNLPARYPEATPGSEKFLLKAVLATSVLLLCALAQLGEEYYFRVSEKAERNGGGAAAGAAVTIR
jgi:hypothetical protein